MDSDISNINDILSGLNSAQREAVTSSAGVLQILAPPGSGKTKTLTARVAYLIAHQRLKPWNIIVCTFTKKAANEMKGRIRSLVGDEVAKQLKLGTFHSISLRYLKQYGPYIGLSKDFGIADSSDSKAIVKRIIKQLDFGLDAGQARSRISTQKAKGIGSEQYSQSAKKVDQQEFAQLYREYEATLKASNLLDYDDLLLRCCFLLTTHPQCVCNVEALLIDEFQDTSNIQYDLMGLFAQQRNNITIVGDPDQSIYGFRSADIKNLTRMKRQWIDTLTINLRENYRSSGAILHAAQHIIEQDESRPPKKLQATHSHGLRPVLRKLPSAAAEARWLVSEVKRMQALTGGLLQHHDFAVLLRSAYLSRGIEAALGEAGVPYRMIGGTRFYDRVEVKLILDYLRVIDQPDNSEAVSRIINVPARRIGEGTVKALHEEAYSKGVTLWLLILDTIQARYNPSTKLTDPSRKGLASFVNVILSIRKKLNNAENERLTLLEVVSLLLKKLCFQDYLKKKYPDDYEARWANVEELVAQANEASTPGRLQTMLEETALPSIEGLDQQNSATVEDMLSLFLSNIALTASTEEKSELQGEVVPQLTISTIHAAKGLEWPVVFLPGCYDGSIPHSRAEDNDEERRLLYVGMTRAQALLYLSCPVKNSQREETAISTFLVQPGVRRFFEEHGPSISLPSVESLATTLRRNAPLPVEIEHGKHDLERDEDNYWPLTGEEPLAEVAKWNYGEADSTLQIHGSAKPATVFSSARTTMQRQITFSAASTTMKTGFVSVAAQYDELMEQVQLRKVDKRIEQAEDDVNEKPKGRKRQIEGQSSIVGFISKGQHASTSGTQGEPDASSIWKKPKHEFHEKPPTPLSGHERTKSLLSKHRPRNSPLQARPRGTRPNDTNSHDNYVFLSSSPPPLDNEGQGSETIPTNEVDSVEDCGHIKARPASTFHNTSMQAVAPQRRTLGMRRSLHGWKARGGKTLI